MTSIYELARMSHDEIHAKLNTPEDVCNCICPECWDKPNQECICKNCQPCIDIRKDK